MPFPIFGGIDVFGVERVGKEGFAISFSEVFLVQGFCILKLLFEFRYEGIGEDGDAVIIALASAHDDLAVGEVDVFDTQTQTFHDAKPGAIEYLCHEAGGSAHQANDLDGFGLGEYGGKPFGAGCVGEVWREGEVDLENGAVQKENGA